MDFGTRLKELRIKKGLSQQELANLIKEKLTGDLKRNTISNYENNKSSPDLETLEAIGRILETDMNHLLGFQPVNTNLIESLVYEGAANYGPEEFLKPIYKKMSEIKQVLIDQAAGEKELLKYLRMSYKMNEELIKKVCEMYEKYNTAYSFLRTQLDP